MGEMSEMCACLVFMLCEPLNTSIMVLLVLRSAQLSMRFSCSKCQNFRLTASWHWEHNQNDLREIRKLRLCFLNLHIYISIHIEPKNHEIVCPNKKEVDQGPWSISRILGLMCILIRSEPSFFQSPQCTRHGKNLWYSNLDLLVARPRQLRCLCRAIRRSRFSYLRFFLWTSSPVDWNQAVHS